MEKQDLIALGAAANSAYPYIRRVILSQQEMCLQNLIRDFRSGKSTYERMLQQVAQLAAFDTILTEADMAIKIGMKHEPEIRNA